MRREAVVVVALLGACRRDAPAPAPREPARDVTAPPAPTLPPAPVDAGPDPCAPRFNERLPAPIELEGPLALACDEGRVVGRWRALGVEVQGEHALREGASWQITSLLDAQGAPPPVEVSVGVQSGVVQLAALSRSQTLTVDVGDAGGGEVSLATLGLREAASPRVLYARGGRALVVMNARASGGERAVWLVALGDGAATATPAMPGALGAVRSGAPSLLTAVVTQADRTVSLRGRWLDVDAALAATRAPRARLDGAWRTDASVALPHRGAEFSPTVSDDGALLVQGVIGAERGAASLVRFRPEGGAEEVFLGVIPSALGDVWRTRQGVTARWWDERYRPRTRRFGHDAGAAVSAPGEALADAFAALRAARLDRRLLCGDRVWAVSVSEGALSLRPDGCAPAR